MKHDEAWQGLVGRGEGVGGWWWVGKMKVPIFRESNHAREGIGVSSKVGGAPL